MTRWLVTIRLSGGREFSQHVEGTDAEIVNGRLVIRKHRKRVASFPPDRWVNFQEVHGDR